MSAKSRKRTLPTNPDLNRRSGAVQPLSLIVAYSEGKTEAVYLRQFARTIGTRLFEVDFLGENGVPSTVVQKCLDRKLELEAMSRRRDASEFEKNFSVWAVFDRDEHPCYERAIHEALTNGIQVAFSNPCCEIWGILHCRDYGDRPIDRYEAQSLLRDLMPDYDHNRNPIFDLDTMISGYPQARERAHKLLKHREDHADLFGCPATQLVSLVEFLEYSSKSPTERSKEKDQILQKIREIELSEAYLTGDPGVHSARSLLYAQMKRMK